MTTPAGWFPDTNAPGTERYWDGSQWTEQTRPTTAQPHPAPPASTQTVAGAAQKNWFLRHKVLTGIGAFVLLAVIGSALGSGSGSTSTNSNDASNGTPVVTGTHSPAAHAPKPAAPKETSGQRNARRAAANYLSISPFSRLGLIDQLSSSAGDGYSLADATYGVDAQHANWNEEAYKAAKNYLSMSSFSRQGLIAQLESSAGDKYTHAQAVYGADKALAG